MLARARELALAEGLTNVTFEQADAQVHRFEPDAYDVVLSRFGAMFFADRTAAFSNIARAMQPGGRLDALRQTLADHETAEGVRFGSAAALISARRVKP